MRFRAVELSGRVDGSLLAPRVVQRENSLGLTSVLLPIGLVSAASISVLLIALEAQSRWAYADGAPPSARSCDVIPDKPWWKWACVSETGGLQAAVQREPQPAEIQRTSDDGIPQAVPTAWSVMKAERSDPSPPQASSDPPVFDRPIALPVGSVALLKAVPAEPIALPLAAEPAKRQIPERSAIHALEVDVMVTASLPQPDMLAVLRDSERTGVAPEQTFVAASPGCDERDCAASATDRGETLERLAISVPQVPPLPATLTVPSAIVVSLPPEVQLPSIAAPAPAVPSSKPVDEVTRDRKDKATSFAKTTGTSDESRKGRSSSAGVVDKSQRSRSGQAKTDDFFGGAFGRAASAVGRAAEKGAAVRDTPAGRSESGRSGRSASSEGSGSSGKASDAGRGGGSGGNARSSDAQGSASSGNGGRGGSNGEARGNDSGNGRGNDGRGGEAKGSDGRGDGGGKGGEGGGRGGEGKGGEGRGGDGRGGEGKGGDGGKGGEGKGGKD